MHDLSDRIDVPVETGSLLRWMRASGWFLVLAGALFATIVGTMVAIQPTSELDLDVILPGQGDAASDFSPRPRSTDNGEAEATRVRCFLIALSAVVAAPLIVPRRLYRFALWASAALVASFVAVSILRLGILYTPTLGLQIGALSRYCLRSRPRSAAAT